MLGDAYVLQHTGSAAALSAASTATFATASKVEAIIRPGNRDEVQQSVRIANRFGIPIYPISTGKNWGYGSRVPVHDGVLLDLGRLNRILDFDEDLACVTIEPGVTQRQLYEFLQRQRSRLWMDASGASPDCSIIGNTLERGFGHTPAGDHWENACGFEVVPPTGECIETGFGRIHGAIIANLHRSGVGPSLDGLLPQSNLGIVTRMTVWLMPAPDYFQAFFFMCSDQGGLAPIIDALRPLRLDGTLRGIAHIGNDYKVAGATGQYPWGDHQGQTPLRTEREFNAVEGNLVVAGLGGHAIADAGDRHIRGQKPRVVRRCESPIRREARHRRVGQVARHKCAHVIELFFRRSMLLNVVACQ